MRRRRRYYQTKCNAASPAVSINDVKARDQLDVLERISLHHRQVLKKMKPLKWDTRKNIYKSLRSYLYWKMHWLYTRKKVVDLAKQTQQHYNDMHRQFGCHHPTSLLDVRDGQEADSVDAQELTIHRPTMDTYLALCRTMDRHNKILKDLQLEYDQMQELMRLPEWRDISKQICHGGRLAYSVAMACHTGTLSRNKAPEHKMFGWNLSGMQNRYPENKKHPMFRRVREVMRGMHPRIQPTKGPRPSMSEGWDILNKSDPYEPSLPPNTPPQRFKDIVRNSKSRGVVGGNEYLFGRSPELTDCTPQMVRCIREEVMRDGGKALRMRNKVVRKIMQLREAVWADRNEESYDDDGVQHSVVVRRCISPRQDPTNSVETLFLAMPTHLGGDDYIIPAMWVGTTMTTATGWVYLRRGWPDMYHQHILPPVDDDNSGEIPLETPMAEWVRDYKRKTIAEKLAIIEAHMPDADRVAEILERGSATFFGLLRNKELKGLTQKQRYARVLVKLRRLPCLTRQDSYGVSNCTPGTESFIQALTKASKLPQLGDGKEVDGRRLALCWKRAKYIQEDRFTNVVNKLYEPYQAELDAKAAADNRLDQRIAECMESEGWQPQGMQVSSGNSQPIGPVKITDESQIDDDGRLVVQVQPAEAFAIDPVQEDVLLLTDINTHSINLRSEDLLWNQYILNSENQQSVPAN